jgi:ADP-dependent NAD(P)H-hydrate dehydratase / NAD(P)H-hydrate epimerase
MKPVVAVAQMGAFDAAAMERTSQAELVHRAGYALAMGARRLLPRISGARICVIAGPGSNGADGRVAASVLARRGAKVRIVGPEVVAAELAGADLVIDAAYGTGLSRDFVAPAVPEGARVLACDLPSGLDGDTGESHGSPMRADATVCMAALKSGLLLGDGPELCGTVEVAEIGIATEGTTMGLVEDADLAQIPPKAHREHKWTAAVVAMAGSAGMEGAAALCADGALSAGAGMVRVVTTGDVGGLPLEVVSRTVEASQLAEQVQAEAGRAGAIVVGPGLGHEPMASAAVRQVLEHRVAPVVLDADGLTAVGSLDELSRLVAARPHGVVCTPHDGELSRLLGRVVGPDRIERLVEATAATGAVILSKGPTTVVVDPGGRVAFVTSGTPALATAGTGDVLSGIIAALLARGLEPFEAASLGAHLHGRASAAATGTLLAGELGSLVGEVLAEVHRGR